MQAKTFTILYGVSGHLQARASYEIEDVTLAEAIEDARSNLGHPFQIAPRDNLLWSAGLVNWVNVLDEAGELVARIEDEDGERTTSVYGD